MQRRLNRGKQGGGRGDGAFQNFKWGGRRCLNPSNFSNSFFSILVLQYHFAAHLQDSNVGNTGTDAAGLLHVHHLVDLGLHVMLLVCTTRC